MKWSLRFRIMVWLSCSAFLYAQSNPSQTEEKQEAAPGVMTPLMHICSPKTQAPLRCATPPHAVFAPDPEYSKEASDAHYQGTSVLWTIVGTDGRAHNTRVARRLGHGLDEKAMEAVAQWIFKPAMSEGKPVAVQINIEVTYRLSEINLSPTSAQLVTGTKQQFSATVPDAPHSAVNWSVGGFGCAGSACGTISTDGLYTAPLSVPNPTIVIVKATSATDATKTGWARVTIQPSPLP